MNQFKIVGQEINPVKDFLKSVNPVRLEREALERTGWGDNVTSKILDVLKEWAEEWQQ